MQEPRVQSLVQEDPSQGATKPVSHNYWAHMPQLPKPECPRACALKQEKPLQRETHTPQPESSPCGPQLENSSYNNKGPAPPKINWLIKIMF